MSDFAKDTNVPTNDCISRYAAINAMRNINAIVSPISDDVLLIDKAEAMTELMMLPSAKSDIIRCKDCKHKYIENEVWACPFGLAGGPDFYCGYGAEGRTDGN